MTLTDADHFETGKFTSERVGSAVILQMQAQRAKPRSISGRDMVPPHIHDRYVAMWQAEDRALLAAQAVAYAAAQRRKGVLRRFIEFLW